MVAYLSVTNIPIGVEANFSGKANLNQVLPSTNKADPHSCGLPTGKQFVGFLLVWFGCFLAFTFFTTF